MKQKTTIMGLMAFLLLAMPFAVAQENAADEVFEVKGGKEYPLLQRALDRIKLAFTLQVERKAALIEKIEQRRQEQYEFLLANGKTEQAERFNEKTIGLVKNFEDWKARKQEIVGRMEEKAAAKQNESMAGKDAMKQNASAPPEGVMEKKNATGIEKRSGDAMDRIQ
jgi:hypothetical protein